MKQKKETGFKKNSHLTDPALAFTTSVPAFWILSVSLSTSSSVNDTLGDVLKTNHNRVKSKFINQ